MADPRVEQIQQQQEEQARRQALESQRPRGVGVDLGEAWQALTTGGDRSGTSTSGRTDISRGTSQADRDARESRDPWAKKREMEAEASARRKAEDDLAKATIRDIYGNVVGYRDGHSGIVHDEYVGYDPDYQEEYPTSIPTGQWSLSNPTSVWTDFGWIDSGGSLHLNRWNESTKDFESPEESWDYIQRAFLPSSYERMDRAYLKDLPVIKSLAEMMQHYGRGYGDFDDTKYDSVESYLGSQLEQIAKTNGFDLSDLEEGGGYDQAVSALDQRAIMSNVNDIIKAIQRHELR